MKKFNVTIAVPITFPVEASTHEAARLIGLDETHRQIHLASGYSPTILHTEEIIPMEDIEA